ncbi:DNA repair protein endonuclease SAE2/CtIP C-terminus family protein [Acanthocheilonema viteae]
MNSYLYSPVAKKAFSCKRSISVAENSSSLDGTPFLDATASPICLIEDYEKSQGISLDATFERKNSQPLLEMGLEKNKYPSDIFNTIDDIPETPKSVEIIHLTTSKKALQNRSPLLPTQPLPCSASMQRRSGSRCNGTLDSWINRFEPPPKPKPVNADKYAFWLNISPDVSPEKMSSVTKTNKKYKENVEMTVDDLCLSHISEPLTDSIGIRLIPLSSNSGELRRLTSNTADENLSEFLRISPHISSRLNTNQISEKITNLQNSLSGSTSQVTSTQEETNEDELDIISSLSDQSSLPLTPSPPNTLKKPEILRQISLATVLDRSKLTKCYAMMESQHTRSLMRAISSPKFCRNDQKYVDSELVSRFNDDGNVRRKKAERRLLYGFDCRCCADYYEALGLNQDERNKRIDQVSRHRDIEREPSTPEYYWEIGMPNREEQRRRGQIIESNSPVAVKTRYPEYKSKRRARRRLFI